MSKLTEKLRLINICNSSGYAGKGNVFIWRRAGDSWTTPAFLVCRVGFKTDVNAHWQDHGNKSFMVMSRDEAKTALAEAQKWASDKYGIKEWAKNPFGDWMDAEFIKKRTAELLEQVENLLKGGKP